MNAGHWSIWAGVLASALAVVSATAAIHVSGFSGGILRKLESVDSELAARLDLLLERRDELRLLIRLIHLVAVFGGGICIAAGWQAAGRDGGSAVAWLLLPAGAFLAYLVLTEMAAHMPLAVSARFLAIVLPCVRVLSWILFPLSVPTVLCHRWVLRWEQERTEEDEKATAEDEILSLVEQGGEDRNGDDSLEDDERRMIRGVFDLDETLVHEIMTPRVDICGIEDTADVAAVKAAVVASGHSRLPVYNGTIDHVVGIVYAKDLLDETRLGEAASLAELLHASMFIPESKNIGDLMEEFQQRRTHVAIVLDEYGGTAGVVTFEDILEEIVGDIQDEYDGNEVQPTTRVLPDGALVVDARLTVEEISEALDRELPEDAEYDTIGGYISAHAGRIPQTGDRIETDLLSVEVLAADPRRVIKLKIRTKDVAVVDAD